MAGPASDSGATRALARFLVRARADELPPPVRHEARRALLNWLGCGIGGSRDAAVETALAVLQPFAGPAQATVVGRAERFDLLTAAVLNGIASNVLDFDDTHLRTVIHPSVPVASALLPLAEHLDATNPQLLHAYVLGVEAACRVGNAVPGHFDHGWMVTSTCGIFGAAAACGTLLQLDEQQMTWALGLAATQAAGLTGVVGSMSKPYNLGNTARGGLLAALLAQGGFTSTETGIEGERGFLRVFSGYTDVSPVTDGLGQTWELMGNAYKPYPCGIVIHPVIDACLELRDACGHGAEVESIALTVHALVAQVTGNATPKTGLEAKLSVQHCAAAALIRGEVGVREFTDASAGDPALVALRARVTMTVDASVAKDAAKVAIRLRSGQVLTREIAHAIGSQERPMTDAELEAKFRSLCAWRDPNFDPLPVLALLRALDTGGDARALIRAIAVKA